MGIAASGIDEGSLVAEPHEIDGGIRRIGQPTTSYLPEIILDSYAQSSLLSSRESIS